MGKQLFNAEGKDKTSLKYFIDHGGAMISSGVGNTTNSSFDRQGKIFISLISMSLGGGNGLDQPTQLRIHPLRNGTSSRTTSFIFDFYLNQGLSCA